MISLEDDYYNPSSDYKQSLREIQYMLLTDL